MGFESSHADMVSIIMLSHSDATFVEETVKSILKQQTYQNWKLLFVAKSYDETIEF